MLRIYHSRIASKWEKTCVLVKDKQIRSHIPTTLRLSKRNFIKLLRKYKMVYIKPDTGSLGKGIFKVELVKSEPKTFQLQWRLKAKKFKTFQGMYAFLRSKLRCRDYIVQRGIHLMKRNGRTFDFRVMVQKNKHRKWESSGIAGRLGLAGKIVSNVSQGASILSHVHLLKPNMSEREIDASLKGLYSLGIRTAKKLKKGFQDIWEIGMDIGIDVKKKPWILEVNTRPEYVPFKRLPSQKMFHRLMENWKYAKRKGYKRFN